MRAPNTACPDNLGQDIETLATTSFLNAFTIEQNNLYYYGALDCTTNGQEIRAVQTILLNDIEDGSSYTLTMPDQFNIQDIESFTGTAMLLVANGVLFAVTENPPVCPNNPQTNLNTIQGSVIVSMRMYRSSQQPVPGKL